MPFKIICEDGHWNLYIEGKFYCSADDHREAAQEYEAYMKERNVNGAKSA
jgi:hypothetical protein